MIPEGRIRSAHSEAKADTRFACGRQPRWPFLIALLISCFFQPIGSARFFVDYSKHPDPAQLAAHDLVVVSPYAEVDIEKLHRAGTRVLAYLSVVEVASDAPYLDQVKALAIPVVGTNASWRSSLMDVSSGAWNDLVVDGLAAGYLKKGFDGLFLDTVDSVELLARLRPDKSDQFKAGLISLVGRLDKLVGDHRSLLLNRGLSLWTQLKPHADGLLVESLFQSHDGTNYLAVAKPDTDQLLNTLRAVKAGGTPVYVIDYVAPTQPSLAIETVNRIEAEGFHAMISTPQLDGKLLGPLREIPRKVLVLFGDGNDATPTIRWPAHTDAFLLLQTPAEWLGCEFHYLNPSSEELPEQLDASTMAVLLDRQLSLRASSEEKLARWLARRKQEGIKVIFMGQIPFFHEDVRPWLLKEFGLQGSGREIPKPDQVQVARQSPEVGFEAAAPTPSQGILDLQAPKGADVLYALTATSGGGDPTRFDAVFTTPWGGAFLDPCILLRRPDFVELWVVDPFKLLHRLLDLPFRPVPDPTTRQGARLFFTHIDGDGFRHKSAVAPGKTSAEVIRDQVLTKYPFPFTVSVIEAEIRGWVKGQTPAESAQLQALAREILSMPNVEAASHSYSHPFYWAPDDKTVALYQEANLELLPEHDQPELDLAREIHGSVEYIEKNLLPDGKKVHLFLWSGNCRPSPKALALVRSLGIENMNGGDTTISRQHPSVTRAAPRTVPWRDELQVFAVNQNENVYRERWDRGAHRHGAGPFWAGFARARETFEMTESPIRLKPVNIYYHFYSADNVPSIRALASLYEWALRQELHPVTASTYAKIARDSRSIRIFAANTNRWIIVGHGHLTTFRIPTGTAHPDIDRSRGILGFRKTDKGTFIHSDGSPRIEITLTTTPQTRPFLVSSTGDLTFEALSSAEASFRVSSTRTNSVVLGGFRPDEAQAVEIDNINRQIEVDHDGQLRLDLPPTARVRIRILPRKHLSSSQSAPSDGPEPGALQAQPPSTGRSS